MRAKNIVFSESGNDLQLKDDETQEYVQHRYSLTDSEIKQFREKYKEWKQKYA